MVRSQRYFWGLLGCFVLTGAWHLTASAQSSSRIRVNRPWTGEGQGHLVDEALVDRANRTLEMGDRPTDPSSVENTTIPNDSAETPASAAPLTTPADVNATITASELQPNPDSELGAVPSLIPPVDPALASEPASSVDPSPPPTQLDNAATTAVPVPIVPPAADALVTPLPEDEPSEDEPSEDEPSVEPPEEAPLNATIQPAANLRLSHVSPSLELPPLSPPAMPSDTTYLPEAQAPLPTHLVLSLRERQVFVKSGDEVLAAFSVAVGKPGTPTPTGEFEIFEMIENPIWQSPWTGEVHSPGPDSALGLRWIGFASLDNGVIGFHGTPTVSSIGRAASNGCVRLRNDDVVELFRHVQVGMRVVVQP